MPGKFTVENCEHAGFGSRCGPFAIRYTPDAIHNDDGTTTFGLSFFCLVSTEELSDAEAVLTQVAKMLNASEMARPGAAPALVDALETILFEAEGPQDSYDRNGATWTSPGGHEYEDMAAFLDKVNVIAEIARAALTAAKGE